jgi:hypothetical protein
LQLEKKISVATLVISGENLGCNPTYNRKNPLVQILLGTEKSKLEPHLELENLSCDSTCSRKKSQLQPHLQLKKYNPNYNPAEVHTKLKNRIATIFMGIKQL